MTDTIIACTNHQLKEVGNLYVVQVKSKCIRNIVSEKSRHLLAFSTMYALESTTKTILQKYAVMVTNEYF